MQVEGHLVCMIVVLRYLKSPACYTQLCCFTVLRMLSIFQMAFKFFLRFNMAKIIITSRAGFYHNGAEVLPAYYNEPYSNSHKKKMLSKEKKFNPDLVISFNNSSISGLDLSTKQKQAHNQKSTYLGIRKILSLVTKLLWPSSLRKQKLSNAAQKPDYFCAKWLRFITAKVRGQLSEKKDELYD